MTLYTSQDWLAINPIDRAQLLLVIEGLKPGTIISGGQSNLEKVLDTVGLAFEFRKSIVHNATGTYMISSQDGLKSWNDEISNLTKSDLEKGRAHHIHGKYLGYPICCTDQYMTEKTEVGKLLFNSGARGVSYKFGKEMVIALLSGEKIPTRLFVRPPAFTPCGMQCDSANTMLSNYEETLAQKDQLALHSLIHFNSRSLESNVQEYLCAVSRNPNLPKLE